MSKVAPDEITVAEAPPTTSAGRWSSRLTSAFFWCLSLAVLLGSLVRFTVRDNSLPSALIFYSTPWLLLVMGAAFCCLYVWGTKRRIAGLLMPLLLAVLVANWVQHDWKSQPSRSPQRLESAGDAVKVAFWNVARKRDLTPVADWIRKTSPDIVALGEVPGEPEHWKRFWTEQLPDYETTVMGASMYLLTKGSSGETIPHDLAPSSHARQLQVELRGQKHTVLVVDILANPLQPRSEPLGKLAEIANSLAEHPLIIMGDFNTPDDSLHLLPLRRQHQLAFDVAGSGYAPTWPIPLPLMQLDQIWTNEKLIPLSCRHYWTWASDHQPVEAMITNVPDASDP